MENAGFRGIGFIRVAPSVVQEISDNPPPVEPANENRRKRGVYNARASGLGN